MMRGLRAASFSVLSLVPLMRASESCPYLLPSFPPFPLPPSPNSKQLLANEISYTAGFRMKDEAAQRYLILWAENVAAGGSDVELMNSLAVLLDAINNLPNN